MISFVVPCYNEEGNVALIYEEIKKVFGEKRIDTEIVMVNDGSKDRTAEKLNELYAEKQDKNLKIVHFSRNFGKEAAMLCGLKHTTGDYVCFIDADLQQKPEVALEMYERLLRNPRLDAVGAYQKNRKESGLLKFCKKNFYKIINKLCDIHFEPATSDFRILTRRMADSVLSMTEYYRFSKGLFSFVGYESEFIPYEVQERHSGKSSWSFKSLFRYAVEGIAGYTTKPLLWPLYIGFTGLILSVLLIIADVILSIVGLGVPEHAMIIPVVLFCFNVLFIMAGVIGIYLGKTYMQTKNRPVYIEKEILCEDENGNE